jgi:formate hydrogenlyase subunit 4
MIDILLNLVLLTALPPLVLGIINKTKAFFAGRVGPPLLQPYFDLRKLFRKGSVFSSTTSWVFRAGPVVMLAATVLAALLVPVSGGGSVVSFTGDVILFAYLLGLARFFLTSAALDTGSSFEGMGAAREVTFACLSETALFFGLLVLARISGSVSLGDMVSRPLPAAGHVGSAALVLVLASWFILLLAENCRIPFDDPNTHLELTMIHEVMVLDHSGPALGMILYAAALKLFLGGVLIARLLLPAEMGPLWLSAGIVLLVVLLLAVAVGAVESIMARLRLVYVPSLLVAACVLPAFGIVLLVS